MDRNDPRYVPSSDPHARYRAWLGDVSLGAWLGEEETLEEFREAARDQARIATGRTVARADIRIEQIGCDGG